MTQPHRKQLQETQADTGAEYDAIIIGAGMSGLYQLKRLRDLGLKARVLEAGGGVGGTWYWNRYPGARFDSESYSYAYSFSKELCDEWNWSELFSPQPETLRYLDHVADRFDLRTDIEFNSRVTAAHYGEAARRWTIVVEDGREYRARFLVTAIGPLSAYTVPRFPGMDNFAGQSFHTARWPHQPVDFTGKRVAVIGTGATGVQTIQEVAKTAGQLTVFQRTPNWCSPLHNRPLTDEDRREIKEDYDAIFQRCRDAFSGFIHSPDPRLASEVPPDERLALYEELYASPGFRFWMGNFSDIMRNPETNAEISRFVADKIRSRVKDPIIAETLIPKNHGYGTRRVPLETRYFEVFNQPNVELVDLLKTPIEGVTKTGIRTNEKDYAFDIIIYATGFDAVTGAFDRIDIRGEDGLSLKEKWADGARTLVGMLVDGFPNLFMLVGPHSILGNIPRSIELNVDWVTDLIAFMHERHLTYVNARPEVVEAWTTHVHKASEGHLSNDVDSWFMGVNINVEGKRVRRLSRYTGTAKTFREWCDAVVADNYKQLTFEAEHEDRKATPQSAA